MRRLLLPFLLLISACTPPDRSGLEEVFLQIETTSGPVAYEALRKEAYERLRLEGPAAALPLFQKAYRTPGAEFVSWDLLPAIARLSVRSGDRLTASTHLRTARLAHRLSLGEVVCMGPDRGVFVQRGDDTVPAFGPEDLGSALLVSTTMCASRDIYPQRPKTEADVLFERKMAAVEALLAAGTSEPGRMPS